MKSPVLFFSMALAVALSGCASNPSMGDSERLALYRAHAGAPVQSFHYFGSIDGWTPLGDSAVAIWTRPNRAYLLELSGTCPDLDFAPAISLTHQSGTVYSRFDKVVPLNTTSPSIPCYIRQISPLDTAAIKQAQRTARAQAQASGT